MFYNHKNLQTEWLRTHQTDCSRKMKGCYSGVREGEGGTELQENDAHCGVGAGMYSSEPEFAEQTNPIITILRSEISVQNRDNNH